MKHFLFVPLAALTLSYGLSVSPSSAQGTPPRAVPVPPTPAASEPDQKKLLQTRVFRVPADFLTRFKPAAPQGPGAVRMSARQVLESLGVSFAAEGSTATYSEASSRLVVRNTLDQLDGVESIVDASFPSGITPQGQVHLEVISMPPLVARKALIAHAAEKDLYQWLHTAMEQKSADIRLEHHSITMVRGGQKSRTEGVDEIAYGSKFNTPPVPSTVEISASAASPTLPTGQDVLDAAQTLGAEPSVIQMRTAGQILEVELTLGEEGKSVDLNLAPESSRRIGIMTWGKQEVPQPSFEVRRTSTQATGHFGAPLLISTFSRPGRTGVPKTFEEDRTCLLFVTVRKPE